MSPEIEGNDPAFPVYHNANNLVGMSLRDYFAAHADVPWNAVIETLEIKLPERIGKFTIAEIVEYRAVVKYLEADAMLKIRNESTQPSTQPPPPA